MSGRNIYLGKNVASFGSKEVKGDLVSFQNEAYYKISNYDAMRPFFMSIVSDSNHWMFISSNGGLTAGRKDAEYSLFPYYTDDKITESVEITGSKTIFRVEKNDKIYLWEPFSFKYEGIYSIARNLYKNSYGNKVIFEEINQDLKLTFRYQWNSSDAFGFVKKSSLLNEDSATTKVSILDGLQNILPSGVNSGLQNSSSNLVDAYKKCELQTQVGLGVYALSAFIVDKAEPSESLKANIVWSLGIEKPIYLLSSKQLDKFRHGESLTQEADIKAEKGAYFISSEIELTAHCEKEWMFVANVNQSISNVVQLSQLIKTKKDLSSLVQDDIDNGTKNLIKLVGAADGLQVTADTLTNTRHFANTMFNIMRGGIFDDDYHIEKKDFNKYLSNANKNVFEKKQELLKSLPELFTLGHIRRLAEEDEDKDFKRLCFEYLPLKFSRRHGDPSRPWNRFSINTRNEDGSKILDYQGNWRDIFQNWEALAHAYPEFIENMIHKFLNATTFDGYNPYRVTKGGFDWEVIEEDDPWSYIGYWGDHQIIYLLKFLEFIEDHYPNRLNTLFDQDVFVYANVPYKIKSYQDILKNPKDTIDFDFALNNQIEEKRAKVGADGALLSSQKSDIYKVNLMEKLLATLLAKVSNFIPEGGIWLNTQRPEWNDANNALVGNGVSMVTLYYIRRFLGYFDHIVSNSNTESIHLSEELAVFFSQIVQTLNRNKHILSGEVSDKNRKPVLDGLGEAGSQYRNTIYTNGFTSKKVNINKTDILNFIELIKKYTEHTIDANKRVDKLFHAYNLMTIENNDEVSIAYLPEMLEGQVAILSSGYLSPKQALELLDGLKSSALFRPDQYSYILYPNKELPRFDRKNNIPASKAERSDLIKQLIKDGNSQIVEKDVLGGYHFNGNFHNANSLKDALSKLPGSYKSLIEKDKILLLGIFEDVFNHKAFTGRSGLLAVQENCLLAINTNESEEVIGRLLEHYYEIEAGIGVHKSPELYGAFPTDPYSHTPAGKGAQQPGMTGQVKEDVLSRIGELGVFVKNGQIIFNPCLLRASEFLKEPAVFKYVDIGQNEKDLQLYRFELAFTYCQVPVVYALADENSLEVYGHNMKTIIFKGNQLDEVTSKKIFMKTGEVENIKVNINKTMLR